MTSIRLHADSSLEFEDISVIEAGTSANVKTEKKFLPEQVVRIDLSKAIFKGTHELIMRFSKSLGNGTSLKGFYKTKYVDENGKTK